MSSVKRYLILLLLMVLAVTSMAVPALAATWEYYFPITITDNSSTTRTMYPIILEVGGQQLNDTGYMTANGTDTEMLQGSSAKNYMLSTTNITLVLDTLAAGGTQTYELYTGYSPLKSSFQTIVGDGGYFTVVDEDVTLELGDNFSVAQGGWWDTDAGSEKYAVYKERAFVTRVSPTVSGNITSDIYSSANITKSIRVDASTDDMGRGWTGAWVWDLTGNVIQAGCPVDADNYKYGGGFRFDGIGLPEGAIITAASVNFTAAGNDANVTVNTNLWGEAADSSATFVDEADFQTRSFTTANETWDNIGAWTTDTVYQSPSILSVVLEITSRPDWDRDTITIFWNDWAGRSDVAATRRRQTHSWDGDNAKAAQLNLTYNAVATSVTATGVESGEHTVETTQTAVLHFDGGNDYVECNSVADGGLFDGAHTLVAWVKLDAWGGGASALAGGVTALPIYYSYIGVAADDTFVAQINAAAGTNTVNSAATYADDTEWHFLASVVDADGHINHFVVDAVDVGNDSTNALDLSSLNKCYIGQLPWNAANVLPWDGLISYTWVYGRELSLTEIENLRTGIAVSSTSLEAQWSIEEGTGGTITDSSGNGNTGTLQGATWGSYAMRLYVDGAVKDTGQALAVPNTSANWTFMLNNVLSYADNTTIEVGGKRELWIEPVEMITSTTLPDRATSVANDGTIVWGTNDQVLISFGVVTSYESTVSTASVNETGFELPRVGIPDNWWGMSFNGTGLPFYPTFLDTSTEIGMPLQTLYVILLFGVGVGLALITIMATRSTIVGVAFFSIVMAYGANATIVPWWILFSYLVMVTGIIFLSSRTQMGG